MTKDHHEWATAALRTFFRRTFTVLAISAEKDSKANAADARAFREVLRSLQ